MEDSMHAAGDRPAVGATALPSARIWQRPRLSVLGEVGSLTESGSMAAMEDLIQNGMCFFPNSTGNMC